MYRTTVMVNKDEYRSAHTNKSPAMCSFFITNLYYF